MIYSSLYNKNTNEDPKTSTIFEHLMLLPDNLFYEILRESSRTYKDVLPETAGILESFVFWPKWNPKNTGNATYVEPDIFFRFENFDLIVEAKYGDAFGQHKEQWESEIIAYNNEYSTEKKAVFLLAIGGNENFKSEQVDSCKILKCNWTDLLHTIIKVRKKYKRIDITNESSALARILELIIRGFHIMGVNEYKNKTDLSALSTISPLFVMFDEACNKRETEKFILEKYSDASSAGYYIYRFLVKIKDNPNLNIYLGLGMWYFSEAIAIEVDPNEGWAKPLANMIEKKVKFASEYLSEPYLESGKYYFEPNEQFLSNFKSSETYDSQLQILQKFVDDLIENYLSNIK